MTRSAANVRDGRYLRIMQSEPVGLIIDRGAASEPLAEDEFRAWAAEQRVFVSSVMGELRDERRAVAARVEELGAIPVLFERFGGRDDDAEAAYSQEVASSSVYVGIVGRTYGKQLPSRFSATHSEYLAAEQHGLRIAVWTKDVPDREGHEQSFLEEVRTFHTTGSFLTPDEIAAGVEDRLRRIASEDLAPWVKLGHVVFRARSISESGDRLEAHARVRDKGVLAEIESMRPREWGRGFEGLFSYAGRTRQSRFESVIVTTTAGSGADVQIHLGVSDIPHDSLSDISLSEGGRTYSPQDLTELGLRAALLGETVPLAGISESMARMPNPLEQLPALRLSEEVIRPVAHLLLTETLVGTHKASRITQFRLGPPIGGKRRLVLAWEAPRSYDNLAAEERSIQGIVSFEK
jgi:hypothetical protein